MYTRDRHPMELRALPRALARVPRRAAQRLSPAYFALVMATGIVSIEMQLLERARIAAALFDLNVVAFVVLAGLTALRAAWFGRDMWSDLADHHRGPGFFTTVAASAVLGSQFVLLRGDYTVGAALWLLALVLWLALTYTMFAAFMIKGDKPVLEHGISGAWLLAVVAMQSVAVLTLYVAQRAGNSRPALEFLALALWVCGVVLYIWIAALMFYRYVFFRIDAHRLAPPYWISMGAMAISTLAGSLLVAQAAAAPFLASLAPFVKGLTVLCWATGTWWIPILVVLLVWRHLHAGVPVRYEPLVWSAVFPLGMYAAGTFEMAHVLGLDFLLPALPALGYVALAAWALAFLGLIRALVGARAAPSGEPE